LNPEVDLSVYKLIRVGAVAYTGPQQKLKPEEAEKLCLLLHETLAKNLSTVELGRNTSGTKALTVNAQITKVKKAHPWVNVVTMAAIFVPLDLGDANVTAWVVDKETKQVVAEIETQGCGQIYEAWASLQSLGQSILALKRDSRSITKELAAINWEQRPAIVNAAALSPDK
jgi:hypothetical protein